MSGAVKSIKKAVGGIFGKPDVPQLTHNYAGASSERMSEDMASRRADYAASGRRIDEEEADRQFGSSWLSRHGLDQFWG